MEKYDASAIFPPGEGPTGEVNITPEGSEFSVREFDQINVLTGMKDGDALEIRTRNSEYKLGRIGGDYYFQGQNKFPQERTKIKSLGSLTAEEGATVSEWEVRKNLHLRIHLDNPGDTEHSIITTSAITLIKKHPKIAPERR